MLDRALKFLVKEMNAYLVSRTGDADDRVVLSRLMDDNGKYAIK